MSRWWDSVQCSRCVMNVSYSLLRTLLEPLERRSDVFKCLLPAKGKSGFGVCMAACRGRQPRQADQHKQASPPFLLPDPDDARAADPHLSFPTPLPSFPSRSFPVCRAISYRHRPYLPHAIQNTATTMTGLTKLRKGHALAASSHAMHKRAGELFSLCGSTWGCRSGLSRFGGNVSGLAWTLKVLVMTRWTRSTEF